ncbi:hypothetical protein [Brachybacterium sacelli]
MTSTRRTATKGGSLTPNTHSAKHFSSDDQAFASASRERWAWRREGHS